MASLALTMSCSVLSSPSPRPLLLGTAPKPSFLRPLSTKTPSQAQLIALEPSSLNSMASLPLTMSCPVLSSPSPRPLLLGTALKPSTFLRSLSTKTPFPSFLANLPPLSPKKLHFHTKATPEDSDSEKSGNVSEEEGELPKEEESSDTHGGDSDSEKNNGEVSEDGETGERPMTVAERGEQLLLKRTSVRFVVQQFQKSWNTPEFALLAQEVLKIVWAKGLPPVDYSGKFAPKYKYKQEHWIRAYYMEGTSGIFFEVQSSDEFMRRKMAVLSLAVNGLELMELECFPIEKFLDLLSISEEPEREALRELYIQMVRRAQRMDFF